MRKKIQRVAYVAALFIMNLIFLACANFAAIDRSYVNQREADLKTKLFFMNSPLSGLRQTAGAGGGNACTTCAK